MIQVFVHNKNTHNLIKQAKIKNLLRIYKIGSYVTNLLYLFKLFKILFQCFHTKKKNMYQKAWMN